MPETIRKETTYLFDCFELQPEERILLRNGSRVSLTPRMFDLLHVLVREQGHLVNKEALMREVWADAVVEEGNLNRTISALRKALGEQKSEKRFIETVPKAGYRFVANVTVGNGAATLPVAATTIVQRRRPTLLLAKSRYSYLLAIGAFVLLFGSLVGLYFTFSGKQNGTTIASPSKGPIRLTANNYDEDGAVWLDNDKIRVTRFTAINKIESIEMNSDGSGQQRSGTNIKDFRAGQWSPDGRKVLFTKENENPRQVFLANSDGTGEVRLGFQTGPTDWSPDGTSFIYSTNFPTPTADAEIVHYDIETGKHTNLTNDPAFDANPSFSRDGQFILFNSDRDGNAEIYMMRSDGSEVRRLTNNPAREAFQVFSPDGTQIAFNSNRENEKVAIYLMNVNDNSPPVRISEIEYNSEIRPGCWSPDGTQIVFTSDKGGEKFNVYKMAVEPNAPKRIYADESFAVQHPSFSPDGKRLAIGVRKELSGEIRVLDLDSGRARLLSSTENNDPQPVWSPAGNQIVFNCKSGGNTDICSINEDGSGQRNLTNDPGRDSSPAFSPDGSQIVFVSDRDGRSDESHMFRMNSDGTDPRRITSRGGYEMFPVFSSSGAEVIFAGDRNDGKTRSLDILSISLASPNVDRILSSRRFHDTGPALSPDGKRIAFVSQSDGNDEIYLMNADGSGLVRLTRNTGRDTDPVFSLDATRIVFSSDRDGRFALYEIALF